VAVQDFEYRSISFYSRLTNINFRAALCRQSVIGGDPNIPLQLGNTLRKLYICPNDSVLTDASCIFDSYNATIDQTIGVHVREGSYAQTRVASVTFHKSNWTILTVPGELAPELWTGLPSDFDNNSTVNKYYEFPHLHSVGPNYTIPGVLKSMLKCKNCWIMGLTFDENGYIFPISDWRIPCILGQTECSQLPLTFTTSLAMSGEDCREIVRDLAAAEKKYGPAASGIIGTCLYGQKQEAEDHYEERMSSGWDIAANYFRAVGSMLNVPVAGRYQQ